MKGQKMAKEQPDKQSEKIDKNTSDRTKALDSALAQIERQFGVRVLNESEFKTLLAKGPAALG